METIKEYYLTNFPKDELGMEINPEATFAGLYHRIEYSGDIYEYLGVGDSLMRERLFWELSQQNSVPYNSIYHQWLMAETSPLL